MMKKKLKKYLLCNNYYNVINYYSKFFMISNDQYIKGTTFDEISHIYYFDKEIKIIIKALYLKGGFINGGE